MNNLENTPTEQTSQLKKVKLSILSDNASQLLTDAIGEYGNEAGVSYEIHEAGYNQIDLQIFDPSSELYEFAPEFIFINKSTEKLIRDFYKGDTAFRLNYADNLVGQMRSYHAAITARLSAKVIINTIPEVNDHVFGNLGAKIPSSFVYQVRKANFRLMEWAQDIRDMFVCDMAGLQSAMGRQAVFGGKLYYTASMAYNYDFLPVIAKHLTDIIQSITGTFKKCLILDLDNTTWGGIIGDDGIEGIQISDLGSGKIFTELQLWALELKKRGIILAICSKNTGEIAKLPFEKHPDMVLRLHDIAMFVSNWETKVENIRLIQSVLNISFDSMVFVDDNPFEREMVRTGIPGITVPELPEDPGQYLEYLRSLNLFETASVTEDDQNRTRQYQEEGQRSLLSRSFENEHEFLQSLSMVSEAKPFDEFSTPRVSQLTLRSNQFNLRTIRYSEEDIRRIASDPDYVTLSLTLQDRFGHHGLIGIIILRKEDANTFFIDSWVMSCRVLKRGMEQFTMNAIMDIAREHNIGRIIGEYIPTSKNGIVKDHYEKLGFTSENGKWIAHVATYKQLNTFITPKLTEYEI